MYSTEYNSIKDDKIREVRKENMQIAKNYCEFFNWWLENGKNKTDINTLVDEMIEHREIVKNRYLKNCWDSKHYGVKNKIKNIDKRLTKEDRWQLKRGLGLMIEHSLTNYFKDLIIPCGNNKEYGYYAKDFYLVVKVDNNKREFVKYECGLEIYTKIDRTYILEAIDLKLHYGKEPSDYNRNDSIYNIDVVLLREELISLLEAIRKKNKKSFSSVLCLIYDRMILELRKRKEWITKFEILEYNKIHFGNEKNSPNCEFEEFTINNNYLENCEFSI